MARRILPCAIPLLLLAAAGCLEQEGVGTEDEEGRDWLLSGTFTPEATEEDFAAARALVEARGGELLLLESFPVQFHAERLTRAGCLEVRDALADEPFVERINACREHAPIADPDAPTSSPASPAG